MFKPSVKRRNPTLPNLGVEPRLTKINVVSTPKAKGQKKKEKFNSPTILKLYLHCM
jgi:hypothetical protein